MEYEEIPKPTTYGGTWSEETRTWEEMTDTWDFTGVETISKPLLPLIKWDSGLKYDAGVQWDKEEADYEEITKTAQPKHTWDSSLRWDGGLKWDEGGYNNIIKPS